MKPLKQPLTYQEQIQRYRNNHALLVDDEQEAERILSRVNYYRLSAYGIGLKRADNNELYQPGVSLRQLYQLYCFDSQLRTMIMPMIEEIEIELRTKIAYHLALSYGAEGYMDVSNFADKRWKDGSSFHERTIQQFHAEVKRQHQMPCVQHHIETYGGHFPVWAAVELFSFGMLSFLYSIMKPDDKIAIAKQFDTDSTRLCVWIQALLEIRNICAHYGRLYNMPLRTEPKLYKEHKPYLGNRLFPRLLVMRHMLHGRASWTTFHSSLVGLMEGHPEVILDRIGFPENWKELLE